MTRKPAYCCKEVPVKTEANDSKIPAGNGPDNEPDMATMQAGNVPNKNLGGAGGNWNIIDEVVDSSVIQQVNDLSCGQACAGMMLGDRRISASQEVIVKLAGDGPTYEAQLASVLNKLDSSNTRQWIGAGVDAEDIGTFHGLSSTRSWGAQLWEKGNKIAHWVVVDGLDDAGRVMSRDPWQATKYKMDLTEFQNTGPVIRCGGNKYEANCFKL